MVFLKKPGEPIFRAAPQIPAEPIISDDLAITDEPVISDDLAITDEPMIADEPVTTDEPVLSDAATDEDDGMGDIEALLAKAQEEGISESDTADSDISDFSLDDLLGNVGDEAGRDIADMLEKSDNNEAVNGEIEALLNASEEDLPPLDEPLDAAETGAPMTKEEKAAEKKRLKEEKKEARKKAKEEKARLKAEKKAAKKNKGKEGLSEEEAAIAELAIGMDDNEVPDPMSTFDSDVDMLLAGATEAALAEPDDALEQVPFPDLEDFGTEVRDESDSLADIIGSEFSDILDTPAEVEDIPDLREQNKEAALEDLLEDKADGEKKKKKSLFAKILDLFSEEIDDEEEESSDKEALILSDENAEIIEDLDKEAEDGKKGKKGKKDKKGKKGKKGDKPEGEEGEEGEEAAPKKAKKEKKPKKEKPPKEPEAPGKRLNKKIVIAIIASCASLAVVLFLITSFASNFSSKKSARNAYYSGDYQTCYQNLIGKSLTETEEVMFNRSECILRIRLWMREYEILLEESEVRALDSLVQSINDYPELYASAVKWNCESDVTEVYGKMVDILNDRYHITPEQALEIAADPDDVSYTRKITALAEGKEYGSWDAGYGTTETVPEPKKTEDVLPEENDISDNTKYVDN